MSVETENEFNIYRYLLDVKKLDGIDSNDDMEDFLMLVSSSISNKIGLTIFMDHSSNYKTVSFSVFTDNLNGAVTLKNFVEYCSKENKIEELIYNYIKNGSRRGVTAETLKIYEDYEIYQKIKDNYSDLNRVLPLNNHGMINNKVKL